MIAGTDTRYWYTEWARDCGAMISDAHSGVTMIQWIDNKLVCSVVASSVAQTSATISATGNFHSFHISLALSLAHCCNKTRMGIKYTPRSRQFIVPWNQSNYFSLLAGREFLSSFSFSPSLAFMFPLSRYAIDMKHSLWLRWHYLESASNFSVQNSACKYWKSLLAISTTPEQKNVFMR